MFLSKKKQTPAGANETLSVWIKRKQFFQNTDFSEQTPAGAKRRTGGLPRPDWWKDPTLFGGQVVPLIDLLKSIYFFQFS